MNSQASSSPRAGYVSMSFRVKERLAERLRKATKPRQWPPRPSQTDIVTRGIELALRELEEENK